MDPHRAAVEQPAEVDCRRPVADTHCSGMASNRKKQQTEEAAESEADERSRTR